VIAIYRRFASLDRLDRRLVLEAASLMALVWTGLRLLRFPTLRRLLDGYAATPAPAHADAPSLRIIGKVRWAITAVAARFPSATCLVQALAADTLLRRRGLAPELHIGVRPHVSSAISIEAHAWVECEGSVAIGSIENLSDFARLTSGVEDFCPRL
jgi:transglutaminase superfamily protein